MKIALINTKGGCGKTTSAIYLAQVAHNRGKQAEIWDADPQGSATTWADEGGLAFPVIAANEKTLNREAGERWVFIDTPPGNPAMIQAAAKAADLIVIPTNASPADMDRTWQTIEAVSGYAPTAVLITSAERSTKLYTGLKEALDEAEIPMLPSIRKSVKLRESFGEEPKKFGGYDNVLTQIQEVI